MSTTKIKNKKITRIIALFMTLILIGTLLTIFPTMTTSAAPITYNRNNTTQKLTMSNGQQTSYFTVGEVRCKHGGKTCSTTNFQFDSNLVDVLHKIRTHFNKPVIINSGFRCSVHNKNEGGASNSNHLYGRAADIKISGVTPTQIVNYAKTIGAGADTYVGNGFAHIAVSANSNSPTYKDPETKINYTRPKTNLSKGSTGEGVKWLQTALNRANNANLVVDGVFGEATKTAVLNWQRKSGLTADAIAGPLTINSLVARLR